MEHNYCNEPRCDVSISPGATFCQQHCRSIHRRRAEYLAALHLLKQCGIITIPSPNRVYDLLAVGPNLRIEVKKPDYKWGVAMTERQIEVGAFDLLMIQIGDDWVYASQAEALTAVDHDKNARRIPGPAVKAWHERNISFEDALESSLSQPNRFL